MQQAADALTRVGGFDVHTIAPYELANALKETLPHTHRVVVAGGDGTICTAAAVIHAANQTADQPTELAIVPGGTLNHFAKAHGIPTDMEQAARLAHHGTTAQADVGFAGERLFLNTSSVGAYVTYIRIRDRIERYAGYRLASLVAAVRLFFHMHPVHVTLEIDGETRQYHTPLVFIGVGERELQAPLLGSRVAGGQPCLHVLVVRERRAARFLAVALAAATRGVKPVAQTPELDSFLVDRCTIGVGTGRSRRVPQIASDGEIVQMHAPIEYRIARGALTIVVP